MDYNKTMYRFMREYCTKHNAVAVSRGGVRLSYDKLDREVRRVAGGLFKLGVRQGDVVMSALPNIEQAVSLLYATSVLGAIFAPVHPLLSEREFKKEVELQQPKVLAISDINFSRFAKHKKGAKVVYCPYLAHGFVGLPHSTKFDEYVGDGNVPALHMHSGGTSGVPKTVVLTAYGANALVDNLLSSIPYNFDSKDKMLVTLPMFHGFGLIVGVHASLSTDMSAVLMPRFTGKSALKSIKDNKVTTVIAIPRMLTKLLATKGFEGEGVSSLANVFVGGDTLSKSLAVEFNDRMKRAGATAVAQQGYGLTEIGSVCVLAPKDAEVGSIGRTIRNVTPLIVDDNGRALADGEKGELVLLSNQTMLGYIGSDEDAFVYVDGNKYLRTGDIFSKDGNNLTFYGRKKRLIKISGMNVFPSEIERVAKEISYVNECAVIERSVGGKTQIELVIVGKLTDKQKDEVRKHVGKNLSHWHVPGIVTSIDAMPYTTIGKVDYNALEKMY
ncbi:MAG: acyl--CoA ligase [Clostridia bacterium]|nr:acyl--CoA ligase [Clostridia bacterium]